MVRREIENCTNFMQKEINEWNRLSNVLLKHVTVINILPLKNQQIIKLIFTPIIHLI